MKPYLEKALCQFNITNPTKPQDSPYPHMPPKFGQAQQYAGHDNSLPLERMNKNLYNRLQENFYGKGTLLMAHYSPFSVHLMFNKPNPQKKQCNKWNNSLTTVPCRSLPSWHTKKVHKHAAGWGESLSLQKCSLPPNNGAIHNIAKIIKAIMSSATKVELGSLYINAKKAIKEQNILKEMVHPPPPPAHNNRQFNSWGASTVQPKQKRQWTCASIGCATTLSISTNSDFSGDQGCWTIQIIGWRIIALPITATWEVNF